MSASIQNLNDVQLTLLKLFSREMSETEQQEIKDMLLKYYDDALQKELDSVISEKGYTNKDFEKVLNRSRRSKS